MAYDADFYAQYEEYLDEPIVRRNHDRAFRLFEGLIFPEPLFVLDLGSGTGEYTRYGRSCRHYLGVDSKSVAHGFPHLEVDHIETDYRNLPAVLAALTFDPNVFVSLFSIECCHPRAERYDLYHRLFAFFPSIRFGLVSGFYYKSKMHEETIGETGGIISYQTIEGPLSVLTDEFSELRLLMKTPSKMFGDDVVEVWKILVRN